MRRKLLWIAAIVIIVLLLAVLLTSEKPSDNVMTVQPSQFKELDKKDLRSSYLMKYQPDHFVIRGGFSLPMPRITLPIYELITKQWMADLRRYLYRIPSNSTSTGSPISIACSDSNYKNVLLNWLVSAAVNTNPPLSHILILSLDRRLHETLEEHGFDSVYVDANDLLAKGVLRKVNESNRLAFYVVMVLRLTVMRLMNHWGYDAANYDTDAIILQNPEQLYYNDFKSSDLIGSRGRFPESVRDVFGVTMCAGVFMVKSTPRTENFWNLIPMATRKAKFDDQERINVALTKMNLKWTAVALEEDQTWEGRNADGFTVSILKYTHVCRRTCTRKERALYYIWHHGGKFISGKLEQARLDRVWFLKTNWTETFKNSSSRGVQWLREMKVI